jgi:hypothetical protein
MKHTTKTETKRTVNLAACALAMALLAGCATQGYDKGSAAGSKLQQAADTVAASETAVADCVTALNDLATNAAPDLRPQFKQFETSIKKLESLSKRIGSNTVSMQAKSQAYFAKWDAELAGIRSEARRKEVSESFEKLQAACEKTCNRFAPFLSDLNDVRRALSVDLNRSGIAAVARSVEQVNRNATPLKESLSRLSAEFRSLGVSVSPNVSGAAAPAK